MMRFTTFAVVFASACATALGQPVVDGTLSADEYGTGNVPLAVQDTPTGFGDNVSELNAAYATLTDLGLYLMLTGNLETNGNGIVLLLDSRPGGAVANNTIDGTTGHGVSGTDPFPDARTGFGALGSIGGARTDDWGTDTDGTDGVSPTPGPLAPPDPNPSILDPGFDPDFSIELNAGGGGPGYFINIIDLTVPNQENLPGPVPNFNRDVFLGSNDLDTAAVTQTYFRDENQTAGDGPGGSDQETASGDITHAFDNTNTAGVNGFDGVTPPGPLGDPLSATTGLEMFFDAQFLGLSGDEVKIMAFITNGSGDFLANQFLGEDQGVAGDNNLGGPGIPGGDVLFDARVYPGNQFFTVTQPAVPGDFDGDGDKDDVDIDMYIGKFGNTVPPEDDKFDLVDDDVITADDYNFHALNLLEWANAGNGQSGMGTLRGDFNRDGTVDLIDLDRLGASWQSNVGWNNGDTNGDGLVDLLDLDRLGQNWGQDVFVSPSAAPEPASLMLLGLGGLALARRR